MKNLALALSLSTLISTGALAFTVAQAEEINPRALDDKNAAQQQREKASPAAKAKSTTNATEQQADPKLNKPHDNAQDKSAHDQGAHDSKKH